jgi:hypothetical protein
MTARRIHRLIGLVLLLPMFGWAITGLIFFVKPGYDEAYSMLSVKTYPLESGVAVVPEPEWREFRCIRSILGTHLLVRSDEGWQQLDAATLAVRPPPSGDEMKRLLEDAFTSNPDRYGAITAISELTASTSTGAAVSLDWDRMSLYQRGRDTALIDALYKVHYLQWTGIETVDRVLGVAGLLLILGLSVLGVKLAFNNTSTRSTRSRLR